MGTPASDLADLFLGKRVQKPIGNSIDDLSNSETSVTTEDVNNEDIPDENRYLRYALVVINFCIQSILSCRDTDTLRPVANVEGKLVSVFSEESVYVTFAEWFV